MPSYSTRCPQCGYGPIGPFSDNCPICAAPVRSGDGAPSPLGQLPAGVLVGVAVILGLSYWLQRGDWGWVLLMTAPAGVAWWAVIRADSKPLARALGGVYLGLLLIGLWVASRPELLPGLQDSNPSVEEMMHELVYIVQGGSPETFRTARRLKTWIKCLFVVYPLVVVPPFLLLPPLRRRWRRQELIRLPRGMCYLGLSLWATLLVVLGCSLLPQQLHRLTTPPQLPPVPEFLEMENDQ